MNSYFKIVLRLGAEILGILIGGFIFFFEFVAAMALSSITESVIDVSLFRGELLLLLCLCFIFFFYIKYFKCRVLFIIFSLPYVYLRTVLALNTLVATQSYYVETLITSIFVLLMDVFVIWITYQYQVRPQLITHRKKTASVRYEVQK